MPLTAKIDAEAFEALDDSIKALYTEQDGDYVLQVEGLVPEDQIEDTAGLKSALQKEREKARKEEKARKALEGKISGIDLDKYNELLDAEATAEEKKLQQAGEWDKIKEQMKEAHATEIGSKDAEIARLRGELEREKIDSKVVAAISKADGNVELLTPHVRSRLQLDPDTLEMVVLDTDGKTPKVDGDGNPVNIETLVGEMRDQPTFAGAFKAPEQSGSGSDPQKGGDGPSGNNGGKPKSEAKPRSQMTDREKIDYQKEHGLDAFMELPA